jgi:hypothetical protein
MKLNFNRFSGMLMLWCLGGGTGQFVASFVFKGHYLDLAGAIFMTVGAGLFTLSLICLGINYLEVKNGKDDPSSEIHMRLIMGLYVFSIIAIVVMLILGEAVRFW